MDERVAELERLYRDRYVGFRNAVATITGDYESARDAVQEGFARAIARRDSYEGRGSLAAWVWKIVFRAALESRRGWRSNATGWTPDARLVEPDRDLDLVAALKTLPPRRRLLVFLRYFAGFS